MPQRVEDRLRPITPQLAWRVAVLGGIAFVLFGIVFFRLWYLQVLTGQDSRATASQASIARSISASALAGVSPKAEHDCRSGTSATQALSGSDRNRMI